MKRLLLFLPVTIFAAGCIVRTSGPVSDTAYGYSAPEPAAVSTTPQRVTAPTFSQIPEPSSRPSAYAVTPAVAPSSTVVREPSGAVVGTTVVEQQPTVAPTAPPNVVVENVNPVVAVTNESTNVTLTATNNVVTQTNIDASVSGAAVATPVSPATNSVTLSHTNINEAAGASLTNGTAPKVYGFTNNAPANPPLNEPAGAGQPRLPEQPRIPSVGTNSPSGSFNPGPGGTASPNAIQQQQQPQTVPQQPSTAPAPQ